MFRIIRAWLGGSFGNEPPGPVSKIVVGLGNKGSRYRNTRHNIGFMVVEALARESGRAIWSASCRSQVCSLKIEGNGVLLAKPQTYVNRSGEAARLLMEKYQVPPRDFLIILDDLNLPLGKIRIRERGSPGGHRGLESICGALGSEEILRVRLGVSEEPMPADKAEFVLSNFSPGGQETLEAMIAKTRSAVEMILREGAPKAMAVYNA
jgi:peptidyl-tRNA hydrolase, PTH1 family